MFRVSNRWFNLCVVRMVVAFAGLAMDFTPPSSFGLELSKWEVTTGTIEEQPVMVEIDDIPKLVGEDVNEGAGVFRPIQTGTGRAHRHR
jgi:hypothetical protein